MTVAVGTLPTPATVVAPWVVPVWVVGAGTVPGAATVAGVTVAGVLRGLISRAMPPVNTAPAPKVMSTVVSVDAFHSEATEQLTGVGCWSWIRVKPDPCVTALAVELANPPYVALSALLKVPRVTTRAVPFTVPKLVAVTPIAPDPFVPVVSTPSYCVIDHEHRSGPAEWAMVTAPALGLAPMARKAVSRKVADASTGDPI